MMSPVPGAINTAYANPTGVASNGVGTAFELSFWQSVAESNDRAQYEAYLAQYPNGTFSGLARVKIAGLTSAPVAAPAPASPVPMVAVPASPVAASIPAAPVPVAVATPALPVAAPTAGSPAALPAAPPSLLDQLAAVGKNGPASTTALFTAIGPVPARPAFAPSSALTLPDHFCSAVERNKFHDSVYVPAVAQADRNNDATIAHLRNVQALHDQAMAANNVAGANALAHEATEFKSIADQAYSERAAMADYFNRIMAVPVTGC